MPMSFLKYAELYPNAAQAKLEAAGNKIAKLRARGICTHGWLQGPPGNATGPAKCLDCGASFESMAAAYAANREAMRR